METGKAILCYLLVPGLLIGGCIMYSEKLGFGKRSAASVTADLATEGGYMRHRVTQSLTLTANEAGRIYIVGDVENRGDRDIELLVRVDFGSEKMNDKTVSTGRVRAGKKRRVRKFVRNLPKRNGRFRSAYYKLTVSRLEFLD